MTDNIPSKTNHGLLREAIELIERQWVGTAADSDGNAWLKAAREALAEGPSIPTDELSTAEWDVLAERRRQVSKEGWTSEHDDAHSNFELSAAAASYALRAPLPHDQGDLGVPMQWPWSPEWWKPKCPRRDLVRATALIIAEIERIDRKEKP